MYLHFDVRHPRSLVWIPSGTGGAGHQKYADQRIRRKNHQSRPGDAMTTGVPREDGFQITANGPIRQWSMVSNRSRW